MPPKSKDWYLSEAAALVERDAGLRAMQQAMDRMSRLEYTLPEPLQALQWMRNYRTTAPFNAIRAAARTLGKLEPQLSVEEISVLSALGKGYDDNTPQARQTANSWERCLQWNLRRATSRDQRFQADVIRSAVLYDEICAQFVHIPTQIKTVGKLGGSTARLKAAMRYGDFLINLRNPQGVHTRVSDYMTEAVLSVTCREPQAIVDLWGDAAADLAAKIEDDEAEDYYLLCDYTDYNGRAVWVVAGDDETRLNDAKPEDILWLMEPTALDPKIPLLGWVTVAGGTRLESEPAHQRMPMLYPIYRSELWLNANITGSIMNSEAVAKGAQPTIVRTGPDPNSIEVEYGQPGGTFDATPGHDVKKLPADGLDPALAQLFDRHMQEIGDATIAKVLISSEAGVNETFSGFNLRVMTAVGQLLPYQEEGQRFFGQVFEQMLLWSHYSGVPLRGYGTGRDDQGKLYEIDSEDIDPDSIYLSAKLVADIPIDRLQKIQGALQLMQLGATQRYALEEIGVADPDKMIAEKVAEQFLQAKVAGTLQKIQMETSGQIQQMAQQLAQQMQQQQADQQAQQQPAQDPNAQGPMGQMANPMMGAPTPGVPGAQGQSPAQGGLPAAMFDPSGAGFEAQTGGARNGVPLQ